jgi:two-component system response regulator AtoC
MLSVVMLNQTYPPSPTPVGPFPVPPNKRVARVLLVDDESLVRWSVTETLAARGIHVDQASDAASAMRMFDNRCDLVLLDLHLPDSEDFRVLLFIRAKSLSVPVIIITAFATRELAEDAAVLGASIVAKPFELDDLATTVEGALARRVY